jgi:hypothetical protein
VLTEPRGAFYFPLLQERTQMRKIETQSVRHKIRHDFGLGFRGRAHDVMEPVV